MANKPLSKETIGSWRDLAQTDAMEEGLTFLERNHCPKANRLDKVETQHHDSLIATGYRLALEDVRSKLTEYEQPAPENPSIPSLDQNP